jgi:hypothetical protein
MKKSVAILFSLMLLTSAFPAVAEEAAANEYTVGGIVSFGDYEQDNDMENGKEPVEWIVLEVDGGRALLISKYCLDAHPYSDYSKKITWSQSSVRLWLNYTFIKALFTPAEQEKVLSATLANEATPGYDSYGCDDTEDQVFLLSYNEAMQYFPTDADRQAQPTAYAIANGAYVDETTGNGWWWLRSPGEGNVNACGVRTDGRITGYGGREVYRTSGSIRPAIWVNIGE